ncbi:hypothetical protein AAFF_G00195280 [Aldrovandia affinis]|uniref:Uncharacterized protein n=1 Tax=Aldrovandia affinis TaxID=143900 RepID=A0AAD7WWB4_9TELE|nr:hypothetical protein AAFF_G00195280 [Aldrovandia affinis]
MKRGLQLHQQCKIHIIHNTHNKHNKHSAKGHTKCKKACNIGMTVQKVSGWPGSGG